MSQSRVALVIANDDYIDNGLRQLAAPARDADALAAVLGDPAIGDFDVTTLHNGSAQEIRLAVEDFFADRSPEDLLVLHFSCHGVKNAAGELFLASADTRPARLASTAVAADFVNRQMAESRAQRIALFLDCCYGGAFPRGMVVRSAAGAEVQDAFAAQQNAGGGRGRIIVTASSAMEYSFEGDQLAEGTASGPSVFTEALVSGLTTGDADRDGDGWIGLGELYSFVSDRVTLRMPQQNPQMWTFGAQGDMHIARTKVRRVTATALPVEVTELLANSNALVRFGAVDDLRERLHSSNLGQALSAFHALGPLVDDDSNRVATAATAALLSAGLRVAPDSLSLTAEQLEAELTLDGSALALCAVASSPDDWLQVVQDGPVVVVRATRLATAPTDVEALEGTVVLDGPTGRLVVPVQLRLPQPVTLPKAARSKPASRPRPAVAVTPLAAPAPAVKPEPAPRPREVVRGPTDDQLTVRGRGLLGAAAAVCVVLFIVLTDTASSFYPPPIAAGLACGYGVWRNRLPAALAGVLLVSAAGLIGEANVLLIEGPHYFPRESAGVRIVVAIGALAFAVLVVVVVRARPRSSSAIVGFGRQPYLLLAGIGFLVTAILDLVANHYLSGLFCRYAGFSNCFSVANTLQFPDAIGVILPFIGPIAILVSATWTRRRVTAIGALVGGIACCVVLGAVILVALGNFATTPSSEASDFTGYATVSAVIAIVFAGIALWRLVEAPRPAVSEPEPTPGS